jgi:phage-related protein
MAREFGSITEEHKNQLSSEHPFIWLYELDTLEDPKETIRLTNYDKEITAAHPLSQTGEEFTWYPAAIVHSGVEQNTEADLPSLSVTVGNASLEVAEYVERLAGMVSSPARIWLVSSLELEDLSSGVSLDGEITGCTMRPDSLTFLFSCYNPFVKTFPPYLFSSSRCRWLYGSVECGAIPGEGFVPQECPGFTLAACEQVGAAELQSGLPKKHPQQFGGFPGIPG